MELYRGAGIEGMISLKSRSTVGTYGSGYYFADSKAAAVYGCDGLVMRAEVKINNPYHFKASWKTELPGADLVKEICEDADCIINEVIRADEFHFGQMIEDTLTNMGYDGIIVEYEDGSQEVVVFYDVQIVPIEIMHCQGEKISWESSVAVSKVECEHKKWDFLNSIIRVRQQAFDRQMAS